MADDSVRNLIEITIGIYATDREHAELREQLLDVLERPPHSSIPWSYSSGEGEELTEDYAHLLEQAAIEAENGLRS